MKQISKVGCPILIRLLFALIYGGIVVNHLIQAPINQKMWIVHHPYTFTFVALAALVLLSEGFFLLFAVVFDE